MAPSTEHSIPMLPCTSLDTSLPFYAALGFELTYRQDRPNPYAAMRRGGVHLHLFGLPGLDPAAAFSTCLVITPQLATLHAAFSAALRELTGQAAVRGIPRITRFSPGQTRFTVVDPAGNRLIFVLPDEPNPHAKTAVDEPPLVKALGLARVLRDFRNDDPGAARVLDKALAKHATGGIDSARVIAARIELAMVLDDHERARTLRTELSAIRVSARDRQRYRDELAIAERVPHTT